MRRVSSAKAPRVIALRNIQGKKTRKKPKHTARPYRNPPLRRYSTRNQRPNRKGRYSNIGLTRLANPIRIPVKSARIAEGLEAKRDTTQATATRRKQKRVSVMTKLFGMIR